MIETIKCTECGAEFHGPSREAQNHMNREHDGKGMLLGLEAYKIWAEEQGKI